MDEFLKMDIFFFVATVGVMVLTVLVGFVLWRLARILKNVEYISKQVAIESDIVRQDIAEMRSQIKSGQNRLGALFSFLGKFTKRSKKSSHHEKES